MTRFEQWMIDNKNENLLENDRAGFDHDDQLDENFFRNLFGNNTDDGGEGGLNISPTLTRMFDRFLDMLDRAGTGRRALALRASFINRLLAPFDGQNMKSMILSLRDYAQQKDQDFLPQNQSAGSGRGEW